MRLRDRSEASPRRARPRLGRVRLEDVAAEAGVSPVTVSRALHRPDLVAGPTREAVQQAAAKLGYIPDLVAGSLASERTGQVAIVVPSFGTPAFIETIRGISEYLLPLGYQFVLGDNNLSGDNETALLTSLLGRRADAVILADIVQSKAARALLERSRVPVVETWTLTRQPIDMNVGFDNRAAARDATRHLIAIGRRRVGMICGPLRANERGRQRRRGFLDAVRGAGLPDDLVMELPFPIAQRDVAEAMGALLARAPDLDALFCSGDSFAIGALFAAQRCGRIVPDQLAIAGLGDVELTEYVVPALTGIRVPGYGMGRLAAEMVVRRLKGETVAPAIVDLGYELVIRASTVATVSADRPR
jgi:LacI family transcriptional regulator, gluconate utilization system Gnt-I transcriptional repressor